MYRRSTLLVASLLVASALAAPLLAPPAAATHGYPILCGVKMVLRNPSLQIPLGVPKADQYVRANGTFFIQIQILDNPDEPSLKATDVTAIGFHFGVGSPATIASLHERDCTISGNNPPWQSASFNGEVLRNYRIDNTPDDGFFIPIITTIVPDGWYIAAASAFNDAGVEIGRYVALARVDNWENCDEMAVPNVPTHPDCKPSSDGTHDKDSTAPWPWVLPGDDGQNRLDNPYGVQGFTMEVADNENYIKSIRAWLTKPGEQEVEVSGQLARIDLPARDNDAVPCLIVEDAVRPVCEAEPLKKKWPAWKLETEVVENTLFRVQIVDTWGNGAEKLVHVGNPQAGGVVGSKKPNLEISSVDQSEKPARSPGSVTFKFTYFNSGEADAHTDLTGSGERGITARFATPHIVVEPGKIFDIDLNVDVPPALPDGTYKVSANATYVVEGREITLAKQLSVIVGAGGTSTQGPGGQGTGSGDPTTQEGAGLENVTTEGSPSVGAPLAFATVAALAALLARLRRRDEE